MSVSQRVEGISPKLPPYYCMIRPTITLVPPVAVSRPDSDQLAYSLNWSFRDSSLEVVDGLQGKVIEG